MEDKLIFVVCGTTGEWSDRTEWLTRAFSSEKEAKTYISTLESTYRSFPPGPWYNRENHEELEKAMEVLDPRFQEDYTGTRWFIREVGFCGGTV